MKNHQHCGIRTETSVLRTCQTHQRRHAILFPIRMHDNPGCGYHRRPDCGSEITEHLRDFKC